MILEILLITIIIILITFIILYLIISNLNIKNKQYAIKNSDGFGGIPITKLSQDINFYKKNRNDTLKYLSGVYPTAIQSFNNLSDLELASFYNSLWFYFHCQGKNDGNFENLGSLTKKNDDLKWDALPCAKNYPLPYTPQGRLYNFYTYNKYNIPEIDSNSNIEKDYLNLNNSGSTRPGIMGSYENESIRSSGIMWVMQRTIQRNVWYPNGIYNNKELNINSKNNWQIIVGKIPTFNYPNGWYGNLKDYEYIEVTHSPPNTGDALNMSPFWWYNVSVGSGLFLNLGKTLSVKNKISGIFKQAQLLAKTKKGRDLLKKWYSTIDPYEIVWGIIGLCGYNSYTKQKFCYFPIQACSYACFPTLIGYGKAANLAKSKKDKYKYVEKKINSFYQETLNYQNNILKNNNEIPTSETIKKVIDLAIDNLNYNLAHTAEQLLPDETNFFFGINLGFDTLQFYEDPNGNDNYVFEIIDLRIPKQYLDKAKNRDYSGFMNIYNPNDIEPKIINNNIWIDPSDANNIPNALKNNYKSEAIDEYLKNAYDNNWLSIRDPLDINNEKKVLKCEGLILEKVCNGNYAKNMYCKNIPLLNEYKCISPGNEFNNNTCKLTGSNPNC